MFHHLSFILHAMAAFLQVSFVSSFITTHQNHRHQYLFFISTSPRIHSDTRLYQSNDDELTDNNGNDEISEDSRKRFEEFTKKFLEVDNDAENNDFPSLIPRNPFQDIAISSAIGNKNQLDGKRSLYADDELMNLLEIHNDLSDELSHDDNGSDFEEDPSFSLHELVMKAVGEENPSSSVVEQIEREPQSRFSFQPSSNVHLDDETKKKIKQIRAIASDVDGTILTTKQTIHPRTKIAIKKAIELSIGKQEKSQTSSTSIDYFFPATGKSRKGAIDSLTAASVEVGSLIEFNCAGVYLQGLFCVDQHGKVIFEKKLNRDVIAATEALVAETNISIVAYDGDDLYTTKQSDVVVHLHEHYGEPLPVLLPSENVHGTDRIRNLSSHEPSMHKLLLMDNDTDKIKNEVRPKLEELAKTFDVCVTQALPTMLELLPNGCSKAIGVEKLCETLSIDVTSELLTIGDAENDSGMLKSACIGVAVGNACPKARECADYILDETNDEGGAGIAIETFALNR